MHLTPFSLFVATLQTVHRPTNNCMAEDTRSFEENFILRSFPSLPPWYRLPLGRDYLCPLLGWCFFRAGGFSFSTPITLVTVSFCWLLRAFFSRWFFLVQQIKNVHLLLKLVQMFDRKDWK